MNTALICSSVCYRIVKIRLFCCSVCSRYVNRSGLAFMMTEPPRYQTSENHRKSRSSSKRNMKRRDGKSVLQAGSAKIWTIPWQCALHRHVAVSLCFSSLWLGMSRWQLVAVSLEQATRYLSLNAQNVGHYSQAALCARSSMKLWV